MTYKTASLSLSAILLLLTVYLYRYASDALIQRQGGDMQLIYI